MSPNLNKEVNVCEMCGDEGYKQCLITCCSCGGRQHMYCMLEVILEAPKEWQCNVCQRKTQDLLAGKDVNKSLDEIPLCPAKFCSWIGKFMIHHEGFMDVKCLLKAHPPPTIKRKIRRMSIKMPEEIHLTMVARTDPGITLFPTSPTKGDIGLFFFCGEDLGCTRYLQILELLEANDCVLRSLMSGMELIVLSSKLLPLGSQSWLGRPFMWAVLRPLKKYKNISEINAIVVHHDPVHVTSMNMEMHGSSSRVETPPLLVNGVKIEMHGSSSRVGTPPLLVNGMNIENYGSSSRVGTSPLMVNGMKIEMHGSSSRVGTPPLPLLPPPPPTSAMKYDVPPGFKPSTSAMKKHDVPPGFENVNAKMERSRSSWD